MDFCPEQTRDVRIFCATAAAAASRKKGTVGMTIMNKIALALAIIGGLNWGRVGLFSFDLVAWLFGGPATVLARIVYIVIALAAIWCIALLFRDDERVESRI